MPGSPRSVSAFRADPLEAAPSRHESEGSGLVVQGEARKRFRVTFVDRELERPVYFGDLPHPAHVSEIGYESVEDLGSQIMDRLAVIWPQIYTDGNRIEGKFGATLTEWQEGEETWYSTLRLDLFCTVFQVRAHAGIASNERADEHARRAALTKKTAAYYDRFPLLHAKKLIRAASLDRWQQRYTEGSTGEITKCFFPWVEQAYRILGKIEMTSQLAQTLMGHGGFARYLYRFKLQNSPYCACDPAKIQALLHVLEDCDMFHRERVALEAEIDARITRQNFPEIMEEIVRRGKFLKFCSMVIERSNKQNR
ncbi:hypothetical protein EVAR_75387_1 [Eumeta japonica]|uniref:Retrovirus-related Pol polyprotein from type-1 retrotransposable element R1 3 n=1 Tax=Eumeta variegata TaxID=151549 RepID=A0A4C1TN00_EUMVA|nr:hypothetical protein EVAR_75387_1 [Eumeta japonica]